MELPESLAARVFLLAYSPERGRITGGQHLPLALRAAALADLLLAGLLRDEDGWVAPAVPPAAATPVTGGRRGNDPLCDAVLAEIAEVAGAGRRRRWRSWIGRGGRAATRTVRGQLADGGWLRLEQRRWLGLVRYQRILLPDRRVRDQLVTLVDRAVDPMHAVGRVDPRDGALVALVVTGKVGARGAGGRDMFGWRWIRRHRARAAQLGEGIRPVLSGLRSAVAAADSAVAGG